ncbi:MAG: 5-methyltetrahydropteroyltriglutamate--homocysteine S-methyltransferase [Betaproteobacteria bacterium RIFCSPHIGHO2_12_FULL_69_13]|nr:MAG: 5-methyltetrahydropteroyltriglutamate--homocysteine S-methyltransferase [Betaproteobacteria bacterium RIFCSPHIGHO2_12_FULL_69_13]OGA69441.1 MAG: 5-methyltetrahydropteroyltriglutamate--homocysteine S-methyltransferase [Betaproteobacteria bacterium RIFCSPLOWO2_12_FULL_68_20]
MSATPPFRADQVGSLLRPKELLDANEKAIAEHHALDGLRELQDRCIRQAIHFQESLGLHAITDGEYRRQSFASDFIEKLEGAGTPGHLAINGTSGEGIQGKPLSGKPFAPRAYQVTGKLRRARPIEVENFKFVKANTTRTPKQTIPSPTMLLRGGRAAVSAKAYPDLQEFYADIAKVYREELNELGAAGCGYVQLDDTNYAYLCDDKLRGVFREWGYDPEEVPERFARLINSVIAGRPADMVAGIHLCRGNSGGQWAAQGAYEPVAEVLLNRLEVDAYFLEYDDARSGGFEPLRFYPKGSRKKIVLGLVSTKKPEIESKEVLKRRIEEAAKYVPLENLCLSPQCGFASTFRGNPVTEEVERRKLALVVETAAEVWGSAE